MAEQTSDGELPTDSASMSATIGEEEGIDGEMDETDEVKERLFRENSMSVRGQQYPKDVDVKNKDTESRHHASSDHRRHRHHISSHRNKRRRSNGRGDVPEHFSDHEGRSSNGRLKQRTDNNEESINPSATNKSSRNSGRKHDKNRGGGHSYESQRSKQSFEGPSEGWELPGPHGDSQTHTKDHTSGASKKLMKENRVHKKGVSDKGDTEDGEILEDGELSDDADVVDKHGDDAGRDTFEVSTSKSSSKDKSKDKLERKKSDHKGKRNHETDTKRRKRKIGGNDGPEGEANTAPAWGSGYQGLKKKGPEFSNREQHLLTGTKGYQSPPGLYDSPSYSEDSDEETVTKSLMTEGYIDASVAADEKEGIFKHKVSLSKKNKRPFERNEYKRGRNSESKFDGPPRKKALVDMNMSDRPACRFYLEGKCAKGSLCQFNHDVEKTKRMEVCKYHLTVKGCVRDKCQYMHKDYPCKYYHTGAKCYSGEKCKFSHDPLTEETRRALEMRVAAEDIIDMEDTDYNYAYDRSRDTHNNKPSLLGSPPRFRPHGKKIPSLFEIEVHPPGQSSKPSSQTTRPSGFYSETNSSPNAGMEHNNAGGAINSPNMGMVGSAGTGNQGGQHGFSNQVNNGNPGLLQAPVRPNMINCSAGNGRPMMMMSNQQGFQQQRLGGGAAIQFLGPGQMNNNNQQAQSGNNLPPVLNMLGAIIREAAMQKGSGVHGNNMNMMPNIGMGLSNIRHNLNNMVPNMNHLNNMGSNNMQPENINLGPNNNAVHNSLPSSNANSAGPMNICLNMIGNGSMGNMGSNGSSSNMGSNGSAGNMGSNGSVGNLGSNESAGSMGSSGSLGNMGSNGTAGNNMGSNRSLGNMGSNMSAGNMGSNNTGHNKINESNDSNNSKGNMGSAGILGSLTGNGTSSEQKQDIKMDVDDRMKPTFEEIKEDSQDLLELDKIRQQIQAQIDREDEVEGEVPENNTEDTQEEEPILEISDDNQENEDQRGDKENSEKDAEPNVSIEIPSHLPKKQRELFKRIQQQQLLREKEWERQEALKATHEDVAKAELDDWYSSDEDDKSEQKPKLTDVLKKLNKETPTAAAAVTPSFSLGSLIASSTETATPSSASTFNIMQMINTIKNQSAATTDTSKPKLIPQTGGLSTKPGESQNPHQLKMASPISPHPTSNSFTKFSDSIDTCKPNLHFLPLSVDPPVVNAVPVKPLTYTVIKISLNMPKPYTQLPDTVHAPDPAYKDDPRVKWHLSYLEKVPKEPQRKESSDEERPQKQSDPRLKKKAADPRLSQTGDSPGGSRGVDPRAPDLNLHRPQVSADPRLARLAAGNLDPRLNRQNSQTNQDGIGLMNNMGGGPVIGMGGGGPVIGMGGGGPVIGMGGGGPVIGMGGGPVIGMGGGPVIGMGGGPVIGMGGMMGNQMAGSFNMLSGSIRADIEPASFMGSSTNIAGGLVSGGSIMGMDGSGRLIPGRSGPMNNAGQIGNNMSMMRGQGNQMGPGSDLLNRMKGLQETGHVLGGDLGNSNMMGFQGNSIGRGHMGQLNPLRPDSAILEQRMNSSSDPRLRNQKMLSEPHGSSDPRLKNRAMNNRELQLNSKEFMEMDPRSVGMNSAKSDVFSDGRGYDNNDFRSFPNKMKGQGDLSHSPSYLHSDAASFGAEQLKNSQTRDSWSSKADHRFDSDKHLSSFVPSSMQHSKPNDKPAPKFDYRNDPRFKRVNRLAGQQNFNADDSLSPSNKDRRMDEDVGAMNEQFDPNRGSYNTSRTSDRRDPRSRNNLSPQLPDSLEDFDLPGPAMQAVAEPEPDLKVKDHFKAIDPTASPFC